MGSAGQSRSQWPGVIFAALVAFGAGGFFHLVYDSDGGCGAGVKFCRKESWSVGDTLVDIRDYTGKNGNDRIVNKAEVFRALKKCDP